MSIILTVSCSRFSESDFYGGMTLSDEDISELESLMEATTAEKYPAVTDEEGRYVFFFTAGGSVYHRSKNCPRLSSSSEILSGTEEEAIAAGKKRGCSVCCRQ